VRSTPIPATRCSAPFRRTSSPSAPSPANNLQQILAAQEIDHLALAGISTGGIVRSTALQAVDLDYQVTVLSDAAPTPTPPCTALSSTKSSRCGVATVNGWGTP
jgi:nicotinamidase-related amidase